MTDKVTDEQLQQRFFQSVSTELEHVQQQIRIKGFEFAKLIRDLTPASAEQAIAIDTVDRATMLAIKSIVLYQSKERM